MSSCFRLMAFLELLNSQKSQKLPFELDYSFIKDAPRGNQTHLKTGFLDMFNQMQKLNIRNQQDKYVLQKNMHQFEVNTQESEGDNSASGEEESTDVYCRNKVLNNLNKFNRFDNYPILVDHSLKNLRRSKHINFLCSDQINQTNSGGKENSNGIESDEDYFSNHLGNALAKQNQKPEIDLKIPDMLQDDDRKVSFLEFLKNEQEKESETLFFRERRNMWDDEADFKNFGETGGNSPNQCFLENLLDEKDSPKKKSLE